MDWTSAETLPKNTNNWYWLTIETRAFPVIGKIRMVIAGGYASISESWVELSGKEITDKVISWKPLTLPEVDLETR